MKYEPEPVSGGWAVDFPNDDGGFIFQEQGRAMFFCLLLEIREILEENKESEEG